MSVALATMDSAYGLSRLGMTSHHRHLHHLHHRRGRSPEVGSEQSRRDEREEAQEPSESSSLRFSVVNILRPDFGREAILNTRSPAKTSPIKVTALPVHSPLGVPRDLSLSASRLSPHSPQSPHSPHSPTAQKDVFSSHCGLTSPVQRSASNLSRSGSLESLASNRSSVTGGSVNGSASVSSAASTAGAESISGESNAGTGNLLSQNANGGQSLWPAWIYCTRYSDRPSSGPRTRRVKRTNSTKSSSSSTPEEKRPRTAFSPEQLAKLTKEFTSNRYLTEPRRQMLSKDLGLNEQQIKIWFQNKRAKIKKASGQKNPLAIQLMAQGLYNHSTVPVDEDGKEIDPIQE